MVAGSAAESIHGASSKVCMPCFCVRVYINHGHNTNHVSIDFELVMFFFVLFCFNYPVESPLHSDLQKLRSMLIETHLADLRDQTHEIHYEAFRSACITRLTSAAAAQQQPHRERR